jgi:UDP-N-acetylmuramate: L-alanyl-gamma-D-glutamyl-meso-diaminopimelate ligase
MNTLLEEAGIEPLVGYVPAHLQPLPDLVVVGNAIPRDNPQAVEAERLQLDRLSMPEALAHFFLRHRRPLVVAGTHGKTTTTSLASWVYTDCGADPGFLIGGVPLNLGRSFQQGTGPRFIIEGDEYNAAYFDRGPKFLHYQPNSLILTSVEHDHADLYPDPTTLIEAYENLVRLVPETGLIAACGDIPEVREIVAQASCRTVFYGFNHSNDLYPLGPTETDSAGSRFRIQDAEEGEVEIRTSLIGPHNICNVLGVWACARHDGLPVEDIVAALASFEGVKRRLELLGTPGDITVIDDFAHHPTAVDMTLAGLRSRYPEQRLIAIFEPRTLTAGRSFLHDGYLQALSRADRVLLAPIFHHLRLPDAERLDLDRLAAELEDQGTTTTIGKDVDAILATALAEARPGDVFITMSSGSFEGLPYRLLEEIGC